jgi:hypothetical protein
MALQPGLCGQLYMTLRLLASLVRTRLSLQQPRLGCLPGTTVRHLWVIVTVPAVMGAPTCRQ